LISSKTAAKFYGKKWNYR